MKEKGMSLIVKRITKITVSLIFLYGVYIVLHGHLTPGGGFSGGVIIALSFIHLILAFGKDAFKKINLSIISIAESLGGFLFWLISIGGLLIGSYFFINFLAKGKPFSLFSSGTIILSNLAIALKVSAGLLAIFVALAMLRLGEDKEEEK